MAWFEATLEETRTLPVAPAVAAEHFADPTHILAATRDLERFDIDGPTLHFVLEEEDHGVVKFKADYHSTYTRSGTTVRWSPAGGNLRQSGEAVFDPIEGGCTLHYRETLAVDLPVPGMMKPVVRPLVGPVLTREIRGYVDRMVASLIG